jgi:hypothetical protein
VSHATFAKIRELLKKAPRTPSTVKKGKFALDARGMTLVVRKPKGKDEKSWMKESVEQRSDRFAEYNGTVSRLSHTGQDRILRREFSTTIRPMKAIEKALLTSPLAKDVHKDLMEARKILADRLDILTIERETNATVAGLVETRKLKKGCRDRDISLAIEMANKMPGARRGGGGGGGNKTPRDRRQFQSKFSPPAFNTPPPFSSFQQPPPVPAFGNTRPFNAKCYSCDETGHKKGDIRCKNTKRN